MKIIAPDLLAEFRSRPRCELCNKKFPSGLDPMHVSARGTGDHKRLDVPCNLLSGCRACHSRQHTSGIPSRLELWMMAADREGMEWEAVEQVCRLLQRQPKPFGECDHKLAWVQVGREYDVCLGCGIKRA